MCARIYDSFVVLCMAFSMRMSLSVCVWVYWFQISSLGAICTIAVCISDVTVYVRDDFSILSVAAFHSLVRKLKCVAFWLCGDAEFYECEAKDLLFFVQMRMDILHFRNNIFYGLNSSSTLVLCILYGWSCAMCVMSGTFFHIHFLFIPSSLALSTLSIFLLLSLSHYRLISK